MLDSERKSGSVVQNNITAIVIVLGALVLVALGITAYLFMRTRRIELECELLLRGSEGNNFVEIVNDNIDQVHGLLEEVDALSERYAAVLRRIAGAVQHIGVVRFDAFRDLGGLLSFAVALLDDRGNGLVFSSIYGRSESRTYTKPIIERSSSYELSPEEREAIRLALQSKDLGALPMEAKDRDHEERMANLRLFHDREYVQRSPEREARIEPDERAKLERIERERAERRPPRRTPEEPASRSQRGKGPAEEQPRRRKAGRVNHIRTSEKPAPTGSTTEQPERSDGRSLDEEVQALLEPEDSATPRDERAERVQKMDRPRPERTPDRTPPRTPQRRPTEPKPRGLDTPVERLRNREPD
ncbi:MAG: DUF4446 family protein [Candidatus Geothermincolia bacterium]